MHEISDLDEVHQVIGEFVVFFQSIEDMYRRLGWQIVDPEKTSWPPRQFRNESNRDLIDKVTDLFVDLTRRHDFPNGVLKAEEAELLRVTFHALRKFRNRIVHSAYNEVKGGGQVVAIIRASPRITIDPDTGEVEYDQETFDPKAIRAEMVRNAQSFFVLNALCMQLVHWYPYSRYERNG